MDNGGQLLIRLDSHVMIPANNLPEKMIIPAPLQVPKLNADNWQDSLVVQSVLYSQLHWTLATALESAKEQGFGIEDVAEQENVYRITQYVVSDFEDGTLRFCSLSPIDVAPSSDLCKVGAVIGELREDLGEVIPGVTDFGKVQLAKAKDDEQFIPLDELPVVLADLGDLLTELSVDKRSRDLSRVNERRLRRALDILQQCLDAFEEDNAEPDDQKDLLIATMKSLSVTLGTLGLVTEDPVEPVEPVEPQVPMVRVTEAKKQEPEKTGMDEQQVARLVTVMTAKVVGEALAKFSKVTSETITSEVNRRLGRVD